MGWTDLRTTDPVKNLTGRHSAQPSGKHHSLPQICREQSCNLVVKISLVVKSKTQLTWTFAECLLPGPFSGVVRLDIYRRWLCLLMNFTALIGCPGDLWGSNAGCWLHDWIAQAKCCRVINRFVKRWTATLISFSLVAMSVLFAF